MSKIFQAATTVFEFVIAATNWWNPTGWIALAAAISGTISLFSNPNPGWRGDSLTVSLSSDEPRKVIVGQTATSGSLVSFQTWGNNNEYVILLIALADHKCQGIKRVFWGGREVTLNSDGTIQQAKHKDVPYLWVTFHDGDWNQAPPSEFISQTGGRWSASDCGRGICYVEIKGRYNETVHPNGIYGIMQMVFEVQGAALYDPRQDVSVGGTQTWEDQSTWTYSDNAAVVAYNLLRG